MTIWRDCSGDGGRRRELAAVRARLGMLAGVTDPDELLGPADDPSLPGMLAGVTDPDELLGAADDPSLSGTLAGVTDPDELLGPADDPSIRRIATTRTTTGAERLARVRRPVCEECYSGFIIVRLSDKIARRDEGFPELCKKVPVEELGEGGERGEPGEPTEVDPGECTEPVDEPACVKDPALACLRILLRRCPPEPVVQVLTPAAIRRLERLAARTAWPPIHSLVSYWRIDARHLPARIVRAIVRLLNELAEVDLAYRELAAFDTQPSFVDRQQPLDGAPGGVGARWAWAQVGGAGSPGAGVQVVDLEQGWFPHLTLPPLNLIYGTNRDDHGGYRGDHGAAVLGLMAGDGVGVMGIARGAEVKQVSHYRHRAHADGRVERSNGHVADGAVAAILELCFAPALRDRLRSGDVQGLRLSRQDLRTVGEVLLIETQRSFKPAEADHADFDAIRLATALGVIVVEAAGNQGTSLDGYRDETGRRILDPAAPGYRDSGALLVGAAEPDLPHNRVRPSNHGRRVGCHAQGRGVVAPGYGDLHDGGSPDTTFTGSFSNTSAAAAIIAGVAVLVQWLNEQKTKARLAPDEMQRILSNRATGIPQGPDVPGQIGVMPDLRAVARDLGLVPVLYTSSASAAGGALAAAPAGTPSPQIATRQVTTKGNTVQRNVLSLRVMNRGMSQANRLRVLLYRSELSTLVTPDMWQPERSLPTFPVPAGGTVRRGPFRLGNLPQRILPPGNHGFLALLKQAGEPEPALPPAPPYFDWRTFQAFLRENPSHLTVTRSLRRPRAGLLLLPFLISGAPDRPRWFHFEILLQLRSRAKLFLEVPPALAEDFTKGRLWPSSAHLLAGQRMARITLPVRPRISLPSVTLAAAGAWSDVKRRRYGRYPSRFRVTGARPGHRITIRQLFEGEEVGRVSWEFA